MAKKINGSLWIKILIPSGLALAVAGWIWNAAFVVGDVQHLQTQCAETKPVVDANKERLDKLEIHFDYIKTALERNAQEQRAGLQAILEKLDNE